MDNDTEQIMKNIDINEDIGLVRLLNIERVNRENKAISDINDDFTELLEKRNKMTNLAQIPLTKILVNTVNATVDVFKDITDSLMRKRRFKYENKFKWWKKYVNIGNDISQVLNKKDRMIYFGLFLVLLAFLLNFLDMIE